MDGSDGRRGVVWVSSVLLLAAVVAAGGITPYRPANQAVSSKRMGSMYS